MPFVIKLEQFQEVREAAISRGLNQSQTESVLAVALGATLAPDHAETPPAPRTRHN
jgi:hypothetical protein